MHKVYIYLKNKENFSVYGKLSKLNKQLPKSSSVAGVLSWVAGAGARPPGPGP